MPVSYHMTFPKEYTGGLNRCGGLPTHLPERWPQLDGADLTFLFQLYCDGRMLDIPNTLCIQGYQLFQDGEGLSDIVIVRVPPGAAENTEHIGLPFPGYPDVEQWGVRFHGYSGGDIRFQEVLEREDYDLEQDFDLWWDSGVPFSKLGGWCEPEHIPPGCRFVGQFSDEQPLYLGTQYKLCLFLTPEGTVITDCVQM